MHLIFDRYPPTSIKGATRSNRAGKNASRKHSLMLHTLLPAQELVLNVTYNKTQLISLIHQYLIDYLGDNNHELVITSEHPVPVSIRNGEITMRNDLHNTHKEADVIIVNQLVDLVDKGASNIRVVCDDTDVLICPHTLLLQREIKLLCHNGGPNFWAVCHRHQNDSKQTHLHH